MPERSATPDQQATNMAMAMRGAHDAIWHLRSALSHLMDSNRLQAVDQPVVNAVWHAIYAVEHYERFVEQLSDSANRIADEHAEEEARRQEVRDHA